MGDKLLSMNEAQCITNGIDESTRVWPLENLKLGKGARDGARVGIMSVGARELRVGRPSRDKTRIPLMSVSGFNNLQSHPRLT